MSLRGSPARQRHTTCATAIAVSFLLVAGGCAHHAPLHAIDAKAGLGAVMSDQDESRLAALAAERARAPEDAGYRIGPDDLLDIRIPDLLVAQPYVGAALGQSEAMPFAIAGAPLFQQGARVSAAGDVSIPILGYMRATGLTPGELEREIARRLVDAGILRTPQVSVHIAEYRSGVVAVIGSVERPGLYPITRPGATIADLVWAAGGPSKDAGRVIEFSPAGASTEVTAASPEHAAPSSGAAAPVAPSGARQAPIRIDLEVVLQAVEHEEHALNPPVRPGDAISLTAAGNVLVDGWVKTPGSYAVTRGLTVSGAIAAAGGHLFPADRTHVTVKRVFGGGEERLFTVDLEAVAAGEEADVHITDGDLITLHASALRLVPYGVFVTAREMIQIGGNVLLF